MTTVAAGTTGTYTFSDGQSVTITLDPAEQALYSVTSAAGVVKASSAVSGTSVKGPFRAGDVLSITAMRGIVDFAVSAAAVIAGSVSQTTAGLLVSSTDTSALTSARLAGRASIRGRRVVLIGGSETARGQCLRLAAAAGGVVWNAATQTVSVNIINHNLHSGAYVFLSNENAIAPIYQGGAILPDNGFTYGRCTVIDANNITIPYWPYMASVPAYANLNGTSTSFFIVSRQQQFSPNSKFRSMQKWLGSPYTYVANIATGSNNTANLVERLPALVAWAAAGLIDEVHGTFGIGNTLLFALNNGLTIAQGIAQITADFTAFAQGLAPYGIVLKVDLPPAQLNSTGYTTAGTQQAIAVVRAFAQDPAYRIILQDEFNGGIDPQTGLVRTRYQLNGTDNVHPSNEGCEFYGGNKAENSNRDVPFNTDRLIRSQIDSYKSDPVSTQYFDPMVSTTTLVAASTLDSKCTGSVPELVRTIATTGNAARSCVFSYERTGDFYYIYATFTAAAAGDTLTFTVSNPSGVRGLETLLTAGQSYEMGCDYEFIPDTFANWTSVDVFSSATMTYGAVSNRNAYLSADPINQTAYPDGPMSSAREGPCVMPEFQIPSGATISQMGLNVAITAAAAGAGLLCVGRFTCRKTS